MARTIRLSDRAYERLQRLRAPSESFCDTIDRLLDGRTKDPHRFVKRMARLPRVGSYEQRVARIEAERDESKEPA